MLCIQSLNLLEFCLFAVDDITKKWKNLRTIYTRECGKVKPKEKSGAGVDDLYVPKWVFFPKLEFLKDHVTPRTSVSNLQVNIRTGN